MKSLLQSTIAWMSRLTRDLPEEIPASSGPTSPAATEVRTLTAIPAAKSTVARPAFPAILFTGGPELKIVNRGQSIYATCPQCQAMWNVRERLMRHRLLSRTDEAKALTCPACDQAVGLPAGIDIRKLS